MESSFATSDIFDEVERQTGDIPHLVVCGKTGSGKSSLINALLNREVNRVGHAEPTTQEEQEEAWTIGDKSLRILDVPGFGEAEKHEERLEFIFAKLSWAHLALLVVGAPDRAWEYERQFVASVRDVDPDFPLLLVGNRIDMFNPVRDWNPQTLDLLHPKTPKEQSITLWGRALADACAIEPDNLVLTSAGESFADTAGRYGLERLAAKVVSTLPVAMKNIAARAFRVDLNKKELAEEYIRAAAVTAGAIALTPIPLADCIPLIALQIAMIIKIADIYDRVMSKETAWSLLSPLIATFAGRLALAGLLDFFPGIGSIAGGLIGAGIACPMTYAIGKTYLTFFARNTFTPSIEDVRRELQKNYSLAQAKRAEMEKAAREARRKSNP